jgi:DNA-binding transcriptional regulator YdaS (Cro superfamily)
MTLIEYARNQKHIGKITSLASFWSVVAERLGVSEVLVMKWAYQQQRVADRHVINLEKITDGHVKRSDVRPDIYPIDDYSHAQAV